MPLDTRFSPALTIYTSPRGFDALRQEWNELLGRSAFNSIFLTWEWQTTWWRCLGQGDLLLLAWRSPAGELIGIAPLYRLYSRGACRLHLIGCEEVADYLDILIARGQEGAVLSGFLAFLESAGVSEWEEATLCNLYESSPLPRLLPALAPLAGLQARVEQSDVAPYLSLPSDFEAYLGGIDKKQRHEIRRKRRKIEREAPSWRWFQVRGGDDLDAWVDRFIELHRLASADKEDFMTGQMRGFFHAIARTAAAQGWLSLAFIEIEGDLAAAMFNFDYNGRIWLYNSGYDPDAHGALSPGIVLTACLIEDAIANGRSVFDFLRGDEVYKYRFGAVDAPVRRVDLRRIPARSPSAVSSSHPSLATAP